MQSTFRTIVWSSLALSIACGGADSGSSARATLAATEGEGEGAQAVDDNESDEGLEDSESEEDVDENASGGGELSLADLDCPRGGSTAPIAVAFTCDSVTVVSCKDLSNVVLELADGTHTKFDGLSGHEATFSDDGAELVGVWVKAGANHSGDGPGYGQHFEAPADSCDPADEGEGGEADDPAADDPAADDPADEEPPADDDPPVIPDPEPEPEEPVDPVIVL